MQPYEVAVPFMFVIVLGMVILYGIYAKHRERIIMVEKGMSSEDIKAIYTRSIQRDPLSSLKWGILFVLAGIAIMLGNYLHEQYNVDEAVIEGMVCLFVGIGLVLFYSVATKKVGQT